MTMHAFFFIQSTRAHKDPQYNRPFAQDIDTSMSDPNNAYA